MQKFQRGRVELWTREKIESLSGVNLLSVGILGEYLGRTYTEVKGRPLYIVRDMHGVAGADDASRPSLRTAVRAAESADERDNG